MYRLILWLMAVLGCAPAMAQTFPSPRFLNLTVNGTAALNNGSIAGIFTGGTFSGATLSGDTFSGTQAGTLNLTGILNAQNGTANFGTNTVAATNNINGPAASARLIRFQTAGSNRWQLNANATAESGANAGTDLDLSPFSDAGSNLGVALRATRATGLFTINPNNAFASAGLTINGSTTINSTSGGNLRLWPSGTFTIPAGAFSVTSEPFFFNSNLASAGIVTPAAEMELFRLFVLNDTVQIDSGVSVDNLVDWHIAHVYGGGNTQGARLGIDLSITQSGDYGPSAAGSKGSIGIRNTVLIDGDGLGSGASAGSGNWSQNNVNKATANANHYSMVGLEQDMIALGPNHPFVKVGMSVNSSVGDVVTATQLDAGFDTASGGSVAGHGWVCGLCFGKNGAQVPLLATSTIIGIIPWHGQDGLSGFVSSPGAQINQQQAKNGVEFSRVIFNGGGDGTGRAFAAPGFVVDDQGSVFHFSGKIQGTSAGLTIDTPLYALSGAVTPVGASTTGAVFDQDIAWDETCEVRGIYQLTVAASAVTAVSVLRAPACVSNPATLVLKSQSGGVTINTAWTAPAAQTIALGVSGANIIAGTGSALATNATAGFLQIATMAGAPTGTIGAAGKAPVVIDTTNKKICYSTGGGTWECSGAFTP